ncbi:unnamed protein product, partial [Polarella glacialis]
SLVPQGSQHLRCGFSILDRRAQVSLATVLKTQNNVLPCYAIVQQQLRPQIVEEPGRSANFVHSISWNWNGKELAHTGSHRSKRGAKNEAARFLLQQLAAQEARFYVVVVVVVVGCPFLVPDGTVPTSWFPSRASAEELGAAGLAAPPLRILDLGPTCAGVAGHCAEDTEQCVALLRHSTAAAATSNSGGAWQVRQV